MRDFPKLLIFLGLLLITIGLLWHFLGSKGIVFGKLPGDIRIEGKHGNFYFPLTTSLLISAILGLLTFLWRYFKD